MKNASSGVLRHVDLVNWTDVSQERLASISLYVLFFEYYWTELERTYNTQGEDEKLRQNCD
jgi:hypothetical protein